MICKHNSTYLCLSGESYWDIVFSGFVCFEVLFTTNEVTWCLFSCNLTCNNLGKLRTSYHLVFKMHTYLFIHSSEGNSPWKLQVKITTRFYLLNNLAGLLHSKNKLAGLKPLLCIAWAECSGEGKNNRDGIWQPKSLLHSGPRYMLQKAFLTCLGSVQVSEDHRPPGSCHEFSTYSVLSNLLFPSCDTVSCAASWPWFYTVRKPQLHHVNYV